MSYMSKGAALELSPWPISLELRTRASCCLLDDEPCVCRGDLMPEKVFERARLDPKFLSLVGEQYGYDI